MAAGGTQDVVARKLADLVAKSLGQEIIVENKVGASTGACVACRHGRLVGEGVFEGCLERTVRVLSIVLQQKHAFGNALRNPFVGKPEPAFSICEIKPDL